MANLLDRSSLVLTPTAYNNGEALCIKPDDGSGDFTFSRNSAATRVNAQGLVENVQILSSNLVQNGDFSEEGSEEVSNGSFSQEGSEEITNGDFSNGSTGWDLRGVTTVYDDKANTVSTSSEYILLQNSVTTIGKQYKITYDLVVDSGTLVTYYDTVNLSSRYRTTSGTYTEYFEAVSLNMAFRSVGNFTGSIDNVSVREVGQDWNLGTGWSIGEDKAVCDGTQTAISYLRTTNDLPLGVGKLFKVSFDISDYAAGLLNLTLVGTGGNEFANINANGSYVGYSYGPSTGDEKLQVSANADFIGSITNISVKEVGQDWDLDANWSIAEDKAVSDGSVNGFIRTSTNLFESGKTYKVGMTVSNMTTGRITYPYDGGGGTYVYTNGDFSQTYYADDTNRCWIYGSNGFDGSITNISVIEITDDTNLPRISYENFSYQDALGSELVTNGDFATDSDWIKSSQTTISNGSANILSTDGSFQFLQQNGYTSSQGKEVSVTINVTDVQSGQLKVSFAGGANNINIPNTVGKHTIYIVNDGTIGVFSIGRVGGVTDIRIDNVSVKEYLGQEVVPDSGCGSWLFEPQSTNLITYSEDFSGWASNFTSLTSGFNSPDGASGATLLSGDGVNVYPNISRSAGAAGDVSYSVFVKKELSDEIALRLQGTDVGGVGNVNAVYTYTFSTNSFAIVSAGVAESFSAQPLVDGWIRLQLNFTSTTITACRIYPAYGTASTDGVYIWGAQLEALPYATSYIPTEGSTVTRNQDVCNNGGSLATINSTEGVLYAEIAALANDGTKRYISLSDGSNSNDVRLYFDTNGYISVLSKVGGSTQVFLQSNAYTQTDFNKVAFKYKENDFALWINGVEVGTDNLGSVNAANTLNELAFFGNNLPFFGKTKCLAVFPYLTDQELTELTTI